MKKNKLFAWGIPALALVFVLALVVTCKHDSDDGGGGGPTALGDNPVKLESVQVYTSEGDKVDGIREKPFTGNREVTDNIGGTGSITGGKLTYTMGVPASTYLVPVSTLTAPLQNLGFSNVIASKPGAKGQMLELKATDSTSSKGLVRYKEYKSEGLETQDRISYVYADDDVTITGKGDEFPINKGKKTLKDITLNLKKGWNVMLQHEAYSWTTTSAEETFSISSSNPDDVHWVLGH